MKKKSNNSATKSYVVRIPIVKDNLISSEKLADGNIKNTYQRHIVLFYYCGQKNHTFTGDRSTMLLGGPKECKVYTKERAKQVLADCCKYDKEYSEYYRIEKVNATK